jgi:hypothetical protein
MYYVLWILGNLIVLAILLHWFSTMPKEYDFLCQKLPSNKLNIHTAQKVFQAGEFYTWHKNSHLKKCWVFEPWLENRTVLDLLMVQTF